MPVFAQGFAAAEAEFLLHVAPGWNGTVPADDAETRKVLDAVHIGIEVASSPYPGINADGPPVTISDFGNNAGMVVGPALEGWETAAFETIGVRFEIDGETIAEATTATMLDGPSARCASCWRTFRPAASIAAAAPGFRRARLPGSTRWCRGRA